MNNWIKSVLTGLVATGLVFLIYQTITSKKKNQLFTIQYQVEAIPDKETAGTNAISMLPEIIKRRAEAEGYTPGINQSGDRMFDISLRYVDDSLRARGIITKKNKLEFREVYIAGQIPSFKENADSIIRMMLPQPTEEKYKQPDDTTLSADDRALLRGFETEEKRKRQKGIDSLIAFGDSPWQTSIGSVSIADTPMLNKVLYDPRLREVLPNDIRFNYGLIPESARKTNRLYLFAIRTRGNIEAELRNQDIKSAEQGYSDDNKPLVDFEFTESGTRKWARMTTMNVKKPIAIILDGVVISAPVVEEPLTGEKARLAGDFTLGEARDIANGLTSSLPIDIDILKEEITQETKGMSINLLFILPLVFAVTTALALMVFNLLKNR